MQWAIDNKRVVKIFYTTKGDKKGRGGKRHLNREKGLKKLPVGGVSIYRIIEPHYIYQAGNGNLVLVTYDRSVKHIRAFIVDNITDYNFTKNRKTKDPQQFKPRVRIVPKKEIKIMKNNGDNLVKISYDMEEKGMFKSASIVKEVDELFKNMKTAQYVGVQGYWLRNRRCWDNCYRHKRTTQPKTPAQEVWTECWDEYRESINNDKSGWEKYASSEENSKIDKKEEKELNKIFSSKIGEKQKNGFSLPESIYATIEEESQNNMNEILDNSTNLMNLAEYLNNNNMKEFGKRIANSTEKILKEAGLWDAITAPARGAWKELGQATGLWGDKKKKIIKTLDNFTKSISDLARDIRGAIKYERKAPDALAKEPNNTTTPGYTNINTNNPLGNAAFSNKKIIIEANKKMIIAAPGGLVLPPGENPSPAPPLSPEGTTPTAPTPPVSPNALSEGQGDIIKKLTNLATEADQVSRQIGTDAPTDNPQVKAVSQAARDSLFQGATSIRQLLSQPTNYLSMAETLEGIAQKIDRAKDAVESSPALPQEGGQVAPQAGQGPDGTQPTGKRDQYSRFYGDQETQQESPYGAQLGTPPPLNMDTIGSMNIADMQKWIRILNDRVSGAEVR
jgi:hypothetical protein